MISYSGEMANNINKGKKIKATFRTLDSYKLKADLLKIDVEEFELEVLEGAIKTIKKYHPKIINYYSRYLNLSFLISSMT